MLLFISLLVSDVFAGSLPRVFWHPKNPELVFFSKNINPIGYPFRGCLDGMSQMSDEGTMPRTVMCKFHGGLVAYSISVNNIVIETSIRVGQGYYFNDAKEFIDGLAKARVMKATKVVSGVHKPLVYMFNLRYKFLVGRLEDNSGDIVFTVKRCEPGYVTPSEMLSECMGIVEMYRGDHSEAQLQRDYSNFVDVLTQTKGQGLMNDVVLIGRKPASK